MDRVISPCVVNRQLLNDVVAKLTEIKALTKAQKKAALDQDAESVEDLHQPIQAVFRAKQRAVEAWIRHHREHAS